MYGVLKKLNPPLAREFYGEAAWLPEQNKTFLIIDGGNYLMTSPIASVEIMENVYRFVTLNSEYEFTLLPVPEKEVA
jgi:predicted transcriptional regulator